MWHDISPRFLSQNFSANFSTVFTKISEKEKRGKKNSTQKIKLRVPGCADDCKTGNKNQFESRIYKRGENELGTEDKSERVRKSNNTVNLYRLDDDLANWFSFLLSFPVLLSCVFVCVNCWRRSSKNTFYG